MSFEPWPTQLSSQMLPRAAPGSLEASDTGFPLITHRNSCIWGLKQYKMVPCLSLSSGFTAHGSPLQRSCCPARLYECGEVLVKEQPGSSSSEYLQCILGTCTRHRAMNNFPLLRTPLPSGSAKAQTFPSVGSGPLICSGKQQHQKPTPSGMACTILSVAFST